MNKDPVKGRAKEATTTITEAAGRTSTPRGNKEKTKPVKNREDALDDALEETFPASDPVSIVPEKSEKPKP